MSWSMRAAVAMRVAVGPMVRALTSARTVLHVRRAVTPSTTATLAHLTLRAVGTKEALVLQRYLIYD